MKVLARLFIPKELNQDTTLDFEYLPRVGEELVRDENGNGISGNVEAVRWVYMDGKYVPWLRIRCCGGVDDVTGT